MAVKMGVRELLRAIDNAETISDLFKLVKEQNINMRMHTLPGASNIKPKRLEIRSFPPGTSYLDKLKAAVRLTVENTIMSKDELIEAVDKAESISDLFTLVKEQDIDMRMHTLPGASNIKPKRLEIRSFAPGTSYLDKLKSAVKLTIENTK